MSREHRTPLKRVSHGSLSALARSTGADNGPTGLDFLEPAFAEFADEAAAMHRNIERMEQAAARAAAQRTPAPSSPPPQPAQSDPREPTPVSESEGGQVDAVRAPSQASTSTGKGRPGVKPKMTAKEKKERVIAVEKVINALPLEYRGSEPRLRDHMEAIINKLMDAPKGLRVTDCVSPPEIPQARANKCLIALVGRKVVKKSSSGVRHAYHI
ncbi:hypothetical protein RSAG8_02221, partial [Rhizoctonia solani AG-8 WAC10335]